MKSAGDEETIKISRIVNNQRNRNNMDIKIPEDYYHWSIPIPFYDDFISRLDEWLNTRQFYPLGVH